VGDFKLGARALSSFRVWFAIFVWTALYSEGAGFGGATYRNVCRGDGASQVCSLVYVQLFPPHIDLGSFAMSVGTLWLDGLYDTGLTVGFVMAVILLFAASRMTRHVVECVFSWPVFVAVGVVATLSGYFYEVHRSLSTGIASAMHL
jgi:hypothetical protein